jgi:hypothetical protein
MERPPPRPIASWLDAVENCAAWMRSWGYEDPRVEVGGPDVGIDLRCTGAVAQVTFASETTGRRVLQLLVGAADTAPQRLFCFALGHYTSAAVEYADARDIALFVYDPWGQMEPANVVAHDVGPTQPAQAEPPAPQLSQVPDPSRVARFRARLAHDWMVYLAVACFVVPFVSLFIGELYEGPVWLDVLTFGAIWFGSWLLASVMMLTHALRSDKRARP